jgi:hypothetical protein
VVWIAGKKPIVAKKILLYKTDWYKKNIFVDHEPFKPEEKIEVLTSQEIKETKSESKEIKVNSELEELKRIYRSIQK